MKNNQQGAVLRLLLRQSKSVLRGYLLIFLGCAAALLANLVVQGVGPVALAHGTAEQRQLLLCSGATMLVCFAGAAAVGRALAQKGRQLSGSFLKKNQK